MRPEEMAIPKISTRSAASVDKKGQAHANRAKESRKSAKKKRA